MKFFNGASHIIAMAAAINAQEAKELFPLRHALRGGNTKTPIKTPSDDRNATVSSDSAIYGDDQQRRLFIDERTRTDLMNTVCSESFDNIYGNVMNLANVAAAAGGAVTPTPVNAGLYAINAGVFILKQNCPEGPDPFEEMQKFVTEYVKRKIEESQQSVAYADISDELSLFALDLDEYLLMENYPWSQKAREMNDILDKGSDLMNRFFQPENSMAATLATIGMSPNDWKGLTFDLAMTFSLQYTGVQLQKLANHNRLYPSSYLEGAQLQQQHKDLLDLIEFFRDYFTSVNTRSNLILWRTGHFDITQRSQQENRDCPQMRENNCRARDGCRCKVYTSISDSTTLSSYTYDSWPNFETTTLCFSEAYRNFFGTWINDFRTGSCHPASDAEEEEICRSRAVDWVDSSGVWNPNIWTNFARDVKREMDSVFSLVKLQSGGSCLTSQERKYSSLLMSSCEEDNLSQQWEIKGHRTFHLASTLTNGEVNKVLDISLAMTEVTSGTFYSPHSVVPKRKEFMQMWYFEDAGNGLAYIHNHGDQDKILTVEEDGSVILRNTWGGLHSTQQWLWQEPHMKTGDDNNLCLARPSDATDNGSLKVVNCDAGELGYSHDWDLITNDAYEFHIKVPGTNQVIDANQYRGSGPIFMGTYTGGDQTQRWTMTGDGKIQNAALTEIFLAEGLSFEKVPYMLDDQDDFMLNP